MYIHAARKVYTNVYLFERNISPLLVQKNARELEAIIQDCIMTTIRESIPTEAIIRAYMEEYTEHEEEVTIEQMAEPVVSGEDEDGEPKDEDDDDDTKSKDADTKSSLDDKSIMSTVPVIANMDDTAVVTRLAFNDLDSVLDGDNREHAVSAPKTLERLESISAANAIRRKLEEEEEEDEDRIKIHTGDDMDLGLLDITDMNGTSASVSNDVSLFDIEELF